MHLDSRTFKVLCQVTNTNECFLMGRETAKQLGYVSYPPIKPPQSDKTINKMHSQDISKSRVQTSQKEFTVCDSTQNQSQTTQEVQSCQQQSYIRAPDTKHSKVNGSFAHKTTENEHLTRHIFRKQKTSSQKPVKPNVLYEDSRVLIDGKVHELPTTKEYILKEYADVFNGIGTLPGPPYHIQLKEDYHPVQHHPRSVPIGMQTAYKAELDRLLKEGVIAKVDHYTEWVNSIVPVQKPNGDIRLCLDPRDLNKAIERNSYYMRTLDDILPKLASATTISMSDATSGYWHIPLTLQASLLTTFNTPWGKFRWLRLPFGLKVASDVFQEALDRVLELVPGVIGIADDIITYGSSEIEHDKNFITLCETARVNGLSLNAKKLQFKSKDCKFFGHRLTPEGLKADSDKIEAITKMEAPTNETELKSFLGMVNYLGRYCGTLAHVRAPLDQLSKKSSAWRWDPEQELAFQSIKTLITRLPVLAYFDEKLQHSIQCDASKKGLGAVLLQEGQPVIYISRSLTETEQRYSNIERELLAVVFALERLNHFTLGFRTKIETDHEPLTSIWKKSVSATSPRVQRLLLRILRYDIDIQYIPGKSNVIADALSRVSPLPPKPVDIKSMNCIPMHSLEINVSATPLRLQELRELSNNDPELQELTRLVHQGWPKDIKECTDYTKRYWCYRDSISLENGLLYKENRLIVPQSERADTLELLHYGHFGIARTTRRAEQTVFWPGIRKDIENKVKDCTTCTANSNSLQKESMHSHEVPTQAWRKVGIDLFEFQKVQYLLIVDYYSKFPLIRKLHSTSTLSVVKKLKEIFSEFGIPDTVMTDGGPQFRSEFTDFSIEWGFIHVQSSPHHHQSNGQAERFVRTIKETLTKAMQSGQCPELALLVYRSTPLTDSIASPAELLNSRQYKSQLPVRPNSTFSREREREELINYKLRQEQDYNKSAKDLPQLELEDKVHVQLQPCKKDWSSGTIAEIISDRTYKIRLDCNGKEYIRNRVYIKPRVNELRRSTRQSNKPKRLIEQ